MSGPAILSSALLARKGGAAPTGYTPVHAQDIGALASANENAGTPAAGASAAARDGKIAAERGRARVSVRLDRDRHLKLRLSAVHLQTSLQAVITSALDRYLEEIGSEVLRNDCTCLSFKGPQAPRNWSSE